MRGAPTIDRAEGRELFGADPAGYAAGRPPYPERVYEVLRTRCGLRPGAATFEIGPGTGLATRRLALAGADPLVAIEPDPRLAAFLREEMRGTPGRLDLRVSTFEDAALPDASFDLAVSATAFHWLDPKPALRKIARALRPGGSVALWWMVFGDPEQPDPFHVATLGLLAEFPPGPSAGAGGFWPFALERDARTDDLLADGLFEEVEVELMRETLVLDAAGTRRLYATFSNLSRRPAAERERVLDELVRIAESEFAGRVERRLVTALYSARRTKAAAP